VDNLFIGRFVAWMNLVRRMTKNTEFLITIESSGFTQTWQKVGDVWLQRTKGVDRSATAEQVLNHVLPLLDEGYHGPFHVRVVKKGAVKQPMPERRRRKGSR